MGIKLLPGHHVKVELIRHLTTLPPPYTVNPTLLKGLTNSALTNLVINRNNQMLAHHDYLIEQHTALHDRIVYKIVPAAIAITMIAATLANLAFFSFIQAPVGSPNGTLPKDEAYENCTKTLGLCKDYVKTYRADRDGCMVKREACVGNLTACRNSSKEFEALYNATLSQFEACKNATNFTVPVN